MHHSRKANQIVLLGCSLFVSQVLCGQITSSSTPSGAQAGSGSAAPPLGFSVISIKPDKSATGFFKASYSPDGISVQNASPLMILRWAYGLFDSLDDKFIGVPGWAKTEKYEIEAKVDPADLDTFHKLTREQRDAMVQALFAERFKLRAHRETRDLPLYDLVTAKSGPKLKAAVPGDTYPNGLKDPYDSRTGAGVVRRSSRSIAAQAIPLSQFVTMLTQIVGRTVEDRTGLTGLYDLQLHWAPEGSASNNASETPANAPSDDVGPSIFTALQEQLGLKLDATKGPNDVLVIDHIEQPSPN
jgi:uncharacterized protein (TIGR03435 family)